MKALFAVLAIIAFSVSVHSQNTCVTPNGEQAQCISIYKCKVFTDALANRTSEVVKFLRESRCGYVEDPLVCCGSVAKYQYISTQAPPTTEPPNIQNHRNLNLLPNLKKCGLQVFSERVLGGNATDIDEFPWMAILEYKKNGKSAGHNCGGILINERYVLTAAHCIVGKIKSEIGDVFRVRLGEYNKDTEKDCIIRQGIEDCADPHQDIDIEEAIAHKEYVGIGGRYHDIGILRLSEKAKYSEFVRPICLPLNGQKSSPGEELAVAGWGFTERNVYSPVKLKVNLPIVTDQSCSRVFKSRYNVEITKTQLCAGGKSGQDSCYGDSGGPLMRTMPGKDNFYVEGVVSFGALCGQEGLPGIYTRVSEYLNWILDNMKPF
ncbi:Serine protease 7 [Carabus blaptoides fortunei]